MIINMLINRPETEKINSILEHYYMENELLHRCLYAIEYDRKHGSLIHEYLLREYKSFKGQPIYKLLQEIDNKEEKVQKLR